MTAILALVYLFNLSFLALLVTAFFNSSYFLVLGIMFVVKTLVELIYLYPVAHFFNKRRQLWIFPLLQPIHILYIVLAGFLGFVGVYQWKGRKVR